MRRWTRRILVVLVIVLTLGVAAPSHAQLVVVDVIAWLKEFTIHELQDVINELHQQQNEAIYIMNRRLGSWRRTPAYAVSRDDTPDWKIFDWFNTSAVFFARPFHFTLSYGMDPAGIGFQSIALPRQAPEGSDALSILRTRLASLDLADAVIVRSADASGALRFAGRDEDDALTMLQAEVLENDEGDEQAMNAILSKLTASSLIEARNAQSALTLQTALVELLAVDGKTERDAHTDLINAQINALRASPETGLEGTADILAAWSLP